LRFITTRSELRKALFLASSVCGFLSVYEISRELLNGFAQIHTEDMFGPPLRWVWRSKIKVTRDKNVIFWPACG